VYVDVWFGTEPNDLPPPDPDYDFNKIVDAVEDANSVTVDANDLGTYYWQVNSYIYGNPAVVNYYPVGDPNIPNIIEGAMWRFYVVTDAPVSVAVGGDIITWTDQAAQLESTIDDDGASDLTIGWTADPNGGVGFTVELSDPSAEAPTVTITKVPYSVAAIANAGFEDPALDDDLYDWSHPGWGWFYNDDYCGTWNPAAADYPGEAPEGESIGWVNPGRVVNDNGTPTDPNDDFWDLSPGGLAQILPETFTAETTYTLTVEVGNPPGYDWGGYSVQIVAGGTGTTGEITGGTVLAEDANSLSIAEGTFATSTVVYTYNPAHAALVGEQLQIRLLSLGGASVDEEVNFDNVQLTANPPFPAPTEFFTVTLTLSASDDVSSDEDTMKLYVYDTGCLAAIGEGQEYDRGDFDVDCDTDLEDYAAMAEQWLVYSELTTSIVKP
jgi:hypothetical protein